MTVTAGSDRFYYWKNDTTLVDIAIRTDRSIQLALPSADVTLTAREESKGTPPITRNPSIVDGFV